MADFTQIIQEINDDINTNGVGAIVGAKLNEVLRDMIAAVNAEKQDPLTIDATPTEDSTNPVQSGGVFTALNNLITNGCLFGGEVSPQEQIPHGNDHSYFYLAIKDGIYTNFSSSIELTNCIAIIFWDTNAQNWGFLEINYNVDYVDNELNGKQDVISDLATIRTGAAAGATAYQKPSGGIPKTDLASGVQTSLGKADTAFQKPSGGIPASDLAAAVQTSLGKADTAIQDVSNKVDKVQAATAGNIAQFVSGGNLENSGINSDDVFELLELSVSIVDASTPPAIIEPNKVYKYGTLSGNTTFPALETPAYPDAANVYCWTFTTPATAPTITWPIGITAWAGGSAPTIAASKNYEVSVMDGIATIIEA